MEKEDVVLQARRQGGEPRVLHDGGFTLPGLQGWWVSPRSCSPFLALRVLLYLAWVVGARPPARLPTALC